MTRMQRARRKAEAERRRAIDDKFAEQHPARAAEERALRRQNRADIADWKHKLHGTPQTHAKAARTRQGALARMYEAGAIDIEQLNAAVEIALVVRLLTSDVTIGTVSLETRVDQSRQPGAMFYERLGRVRREVAYSRWRKRLSHPAMVLAMIVDDCGVSVAARHWRMRNSQAKALLVSALNLWADEVHDAVQEIDDATYAAAAAGMM